ncbi:MAG: GMC family oxidoreductase, partial [Bacteroidales bacterium]|nr:GMC family oxidoreductase [Bacteroidales bacterium]
KVLTIEKGKRYNSEDFPKTNWNLKKYLWMPAVGFYGIQRLDLFKHAFILSGVGVGGGSLVYANTLMFPPDDFFNNKQWNQFNSWKDVLKPYYDKAGKMLGRTKLNKFYTEDKILQDVAKDLDKEYSFDNVYVGVYYNELKEETDPYFDGNGPLRKPCTECAGCMVGCRENAKNTLDKNYLYFAEKNGNILVTETKAWKIEFIDDVYYVHTSGTTKGIKNVFKSKGIVFAGGVLGTLSLLLNQKYTYKTLTGISDKLGHCLRTNSETLCTASFANTKLNNGIAISSIFKPDNKTYIEIVKYPDGSNVMKYLLTLATNMTTPKFFRPLAFLCKILFHPIRFLKMVFNRNWAKNTVIFLVMQTFDNAMQMTLKKGILRKKLTIKNDGDKKVNAYIPIGQEVMTRFAKKVNAIPQNSTAEILFNIPSTAHILGGCPMGDNIHNGVVDKYFKVFGYPNMYITDGSVIQGNIGVNPSYTITAQSEYTMAQIKVNRNNNKNTSVKL